MVKHKLLLLAKDAGGNNVLLRGLKAIEKAAAADTAQSTFGPQRRVEHRDTALDCNIRAPIQRHKRPNTPASPRCESCFNRHPDLLGRSQYGYRSGNSSPAKEVQQEP